MQPYSSQSRCGHVPQGRRMGGSEGFQQEVLIEAPVGCIFGDCDFALGRGSKVADFVLVTADTEPMGRYTLSTDFLMMGTEMTQGMFLQRWAMIRREAHRLGKWKRLSCLLHIVVDGSGSSQCHDRLSQWALR